MTKLAKYEELEQEYAKYIGTDYAVSVNTGTAALHLALKSIGIKQGDEVITCDFQMAAPAFAISYCNATPVFVDCDDDLLIDINKIKQKITTSTKAMIIVHTYGRVVNMDLIMSIAKRYNLRVIEDCCEAQGGMWKDKMVGSYDIGVFSFYINKIIPAEEGGIITTNDLSIATRAKYLKNMAFNEAHDFTHDEIGFNYRMTNSQANYALENLRRINSIQERRYRVETWYDKYIKDEFKMPKRNVVWIYDMKHPLKDKIVKALNDVGIQARHSFKPMSSMLPFINKYKGLKAYKMSKEVFYLPVSPLMTEDIVQNIAKIIDSVV